ncbi:MAG: hypothetical protein ABI818_13990 [Acidobacteriota bacterium]
MASHAPGAGCVAPVRSTATSRQADRFFADLLGEKRIPARRFIPEATEEEEDAWTEAVAELPPRYRRAYALAQQAEAELDAETVDALTFELLAVEDHADLEEFLGKLARSVSRGVTRTVSDVSRSTLAKTVGKTVSDVSRTKLARTVGKAATSVGKGVSSVAGVVAPIAASAAKLASRATPLGALARSTFGAVSAALRGQNILMGALDGLAGTPLLGALVKIGGGLLRGENLLAAAKMAAKAGISDVREAVRFAAMVAPFVPGIGTGVGAALGAADALANGQPITQALIAGARGAIPGGVIAQAAFDTAAQLIQGKRLDQALLTAARNQLPPGPAQAAFDTGLAIAQGKKLQDAAVQGAGSLLPAFPYSADVVTFARRAAAGDNLGGAALSTAGHAVLRRAKEQGVDLVATVQGRAAPVAAAAIAAVRPSVPRPTAAGPATVAAKAAAPQTLDQAFVAADKDVRRGAARFFATLSGPSAATPIKPTRAALAVR